ncbi:DMT family transporter [Rhodobacteraceae bacterium XHP0102]|nr:DMT family transporter [Rhodobacteraceae bacterium XHP0102]
MSQTEQHRPALAALWMTGAIVAFTLMAIAGRAVSFELDTFEIMTYRSAVGVVVVTLVITVFGKWSEVRRDQMKMHLGRNIFHFTGQNLWFFAITVIPLAQVFALEFTSPLWVMLLAAIFLGERLTRLKVLVALVGFLGILLVVRPWVAPPSLGMLIAAAAALCFATTAIFTKRLTQSQTIACIMFYLTVMQLAFGLICSLADGDMALPSGVNILWITLIGFAGLVAHFCLTTALSVAPASVVMPLDFVRLPVIALIGVLLYAEPLDPMVLIGAALIFGANYINITGGTAIMRLNRTAR